MLIQTCQILTTCCEDGEDKYAPKDHKEPFINCNHSLLTISILLCSAIEFIYIVGCLEFTGQKVAACEVDDSAANNTLNDTNGWIRLIDTILLSPHDANTHWSRCCKKNSKDDRHWLAAESAR